MRQASLETTASIGGGLRIEPDTRNNSLMVYSNFAAFKRVQDIIKAIDVPQAQVIIEATIAEVTITDDLQFGVQTYLAGHGITARNSNTTTRGLLMSPAKTKRNLRGSPRK